MPTTSRDAWPWKELVSLEETLRCPICGEMMQSATVMPNCSHNFCATCVARHFRYQLENGQRTTCAFCRVAVDPQDARSNKAMDAIAHHWKVGRLRLLDVLREHEGGRPGVPSCSHDDATVAPRPTTHGKEDTARTIAARVHAPSSCQDAHHPEVEGIGSDRTRRGTKRARGDAEGPTEVWVVDDVDDGAEEVPPGMSRCPVCGIWVVEGLVNSHVDTCLTRAEQRVPTRLASDPEKASKFLGRRDGPPCGAPASSAPKRVPKLNLHMLKEKELKRHLQRYGLSVQGTRKALESRYKEFELRTNAYASQGVHVDHVVVVKEVEKLERDRQRACASDAFHARWSCGERDRPHPGTDAFQRHVHAIRLRRRVGVGSDPDPSRHADVEVVPESDGGSVEVVRTSSPSPPG
eukprot:jgi/Pico_ML_1/50653/g1822.t2